MGSLITSVIMGIFNAIGAALAGAFLAELKLVQSFAANDNLPFGGNFEHLLGFNAIVIPGIAMLVFLVWLVGKGLTGGNSKASTEDMLKRVIGALVVSFALSLIVNPIQSLIGAMDSALMNVAGASAHGLSTTFAMIATTSAIGGIEDSIFVSIVILVVGLILAGILILMLILAHAVVYLLIYFAPYLTLFRKDGFREAVEGVTAALAMPFIITSILAVGIAMMGATNGALGVQPITGTLTGSIGGQTITQAISLTSATTSTNAITYFSDALGGLLILGAAVFLPKFILSMAFQAGNAIHDAFRSGHQQLASTATAAAKPAAGGKLHQLAQKASSKLSGSSQGDVSTSPPGANTRTSPGRSSLQDAAMIGSKSPSVSPTSPESVPIAQPTSPGSNTGTRSDSASALSDVSAPPAPPRASATDSPNTDPPNGDPPNTDPPLSEVTPDVSTGEPPIATDPNEVDAVVGAAALANARAQGAASAAKDKGSEKVESKPLRERAAHAFVDHYKGTAKAIPNMVVGASGVSPEHPVQTGINLRSSWRTAKRESIHQVKDQRAIAEQKQAAAKARSSKGDERPAMDETPPVQEPEPRQTPPVQEPPTSPEAE
ncbi:hypothetical protein [Ferrimicrobium sp.]|uniref:hypothetical protein n=1 Tax=Ferrimicrobium sp. TaxID=2926050 RepID=UPI0026261145|nr:hypothetical protein [Ferrimicrobium sp.]